MKKKLAAALALLAALLLAACAGADPAPNNSGAGDGVTPDTAPEEPAEPTEPAVSIGTPNLDTDEDEAATPEVPIPVIVAQEVLAQQLNLMPNEITVIDYEEVEWENTCLGLPLEEELCEDQTIPGYSVILEAEGGEYELHIDAAGQRVALAGAPDVALAEVSMTWQSNEAPCQVATLGPEGVVYGLCNGPALMDAFVDPDRATQLAGFVSTYQAFEADTPAGSIAFEGQGETEATEAEQRMIAEWARLTAVESSSGRRSVELGLALLMHQEGGSEQVCQDVLIYSTGTVRAYSCDAAMPEELGEVQLNADELAQLYAWLDDLQQFTVDESVQATPGTNEGDGTTPPATAEPPAEGAPIRQMIFAGRGEQQASQADNDAILTFAQEQLDEILASAPPADAEPTPTEES
ncbi:MAG TPA: hypothetical protein PK607_00230 [Aggregatilineales bacterium]|nr:hypothetical protein [Aggregatilineales bacterium]